MQMKIRYLTGRGGRVDRGLSAHLAQRAVDYDALAVDDGLLTLSIDEQLVRVKTFIRGAEGGHLIATSYGGYLTMLSLIDAEWAPDRVLLLSPVLGRSMLPERMMSSRPPRERLLRQALEEGRVTRPQTLQILTGAEDPICCPRLAQTVAAQLGAEIDVLEGQNHHIDAQLVGQRLSIFLGG